MVYEVSIPLKIEGASKRDAKVVESVAKKGALDSKQKVAISLEIAGKKPVFVIDFIGKRGQFERLVLVPSAPDKPIQNGVIRGKVLKYEVFANYDYLLPSELIKIVDAFSKKAGTAVRRLFDLIYKHYTIDFKPVIFHVSADFGMKGSVDITVDYGKSGRAYLFIDKKGRTEARTERFKEGVFKTLFEATFSQKRGP